jgi:hypothetical protein
MRWKDALELRTTKVVIQNVEERTIDPVTNSIETISQGCSQPTPVPCMRQLLAEVQDVTFRKEEMECRARPSPAAP